MDEEQLREQQKQAEHDAASQKTAHVAGKAASTYFGGAASRTKVGQDIEKASGKALQHNPVMNKAMDGLNKSGALDAADIGMDLAAGGGEGTGLNNNLDLLNNNKNNSTLGNDKSNAPHNSSKGPFSSLTNSGGSDSEEDNSARTDDSSAASTFNSFLSKNKFAIIGSIGGTGCLSGFLFILFLVIFAVLFGVVDIAKEWFIGGWNSIVDFFTTDQQELEIEYYETLQDTQTKINQQYGVCIDVNLITAALTVNTTFDDYLEGSKDDVSDSIDNPDYNPDLEVSDGNQPSVEVSYKEMKKQVALLARMQMINKVYGLDEKQKLQNGSYCSTTPGFVLVDQSSAENYVGKKYSDLDSSSIRLIAGHDVSGVQQFFTKKSNEEKNYAYYLYYPPFDSSGNCSDDYANDMLLQSKAELSIGDLGSMSDSVFYWNLVNSFIPDYYSEYISASEPLRTENILEIAEEIYLLYSDMGPSQTCTVAYSGPSSLCPNGITIEGVGTLDFEEYIAGVVSREADTSEGMEALKAQAVAARTYALNYTNYCQNVIPNSTSAQTFTQNISDRARQAARETAGEILVDTNGNIFSAQYDSFCYQDEDCPDAVENPDGTFSVTYTKLPYGEKHTITLNNPKYYDWMVYPNKGHGHGMSQLVSYQLAAEGKTYEEILSYFYSEGVEISLVLSPNNTDGATIVKGPITNYLDINAMNQYIYTQVNKAGVGTREGVVTAAISLVSGIYNQTGYKLPYELKPSGKFTGYGIDSSWGTNTGNSSYPLNGLDCSGFISWAMHNGGYKYEGVNARDWGNSGTKRKWFKGTTDSSALPGDLIYNEPPNDNGTSGHIRMIVDVTTDGYVVAEASSGKNGVRIKTIPFNSTGSYYLVDMSNYYANTAKVTDYPS